MRSILCIIVLSVLTSACAIGVKHDYRSQKVDLAVISNEKVAVATYDRRPYIVSGNKSPTFVGLSRGGFGNPFDVTTVSGNPLAADISETISSGMRAKDIKVIVIPTKHSEKYGAIVAALRSSGSGRSVLVTLNEWKADTYSRTKLLHDVTVDIFGVGGNILVKKQFKGAENLGSAFNSPAHSKKVVPESFKRQIEIIFADPDILAALK